MEKKSFGKKAFTVIAQQGLLVFSVMAAFAADYYSGMGQSGISTLLVVFGGIALIVAFVMIGILTNATSSFHSLDGIGTDVSLTALVLIVYGVLYLVFPVNANYALADRLVAVGVVTYLLDSLFLIVYASMVTQIKDGTILKHCLLYRLGSLIAEGLFRHTMFTRALRGFVAWGIGMGGMVLFAIYHNWVGIALVVLSGGIELFFSLQKAYEERVIRNAILEITEGRLDKTLEVEKFHGEQKQTAMAVNHIRDGLDNAVKAGIKNERMKADLITNVSHDLKTPLTSIINYVNILKREIPESETAWQHIAVMEEKSQRLKTLLEDLVEVSRLTSGTVQYEMARIDFVELLYEIGGEYDERFESRGLVIVTKMSRLPVYIQADGRQLCRAIENLYTNAAKYAKEDTHVTVELYPKNGKAVFLIKNIMAQPIALEGDVGEDLTGRFVRGDKSRTTEGSGLGLSITKEIITQMGGTFQVTVEEDSYTASIAFEIA